MAGQFKDSMNPIAVRMRAVGLNPKSLAAAIGCSDRMVSHWITGAFQPAGTKRPNLARELQVTPAQLDLLIDGTLVDLPAPVLRAGGALTPTALAS